MPDLAEIEKIVSLLAHGGPALISALLLVHSFLQRRDLEIARQRVVELENRVFELSTTYNRTVRKFEAGFSQTKELLARIFDRL